MKKNDRVACSLVTLSQSENCAVEYCPHCETIHLQLQFMTMKLERDSLPQLRHLLMNAEYAVAHMNTSEQSSAYASPSSAFEKLH